MRFFCVSLAFLSTFLLWGTSEAVDIIQPGSPAPIFSLPSINGKRISLRTYCGDTLSKPYINSIKHIVVISFWATYCEPCRKEIPELTKFAEKHRGDSVVVLCLSIDKEGSSIVSPVVRKRNYTLPVLLDPYLQTAKHYGVTSLPALFVIKPDGTVFYSSTGYDEQEPLDNKLENLVRNIREQTNPGTVQKDSITEVVEKSILAVRITPKTRWDAIVKAECGAPVSEIADSLGVAPDEIRKWFTDLKRAAVELWDTTKN